MKVFFLLNCIHFFQIDILDTHQTYKGYVQIRKSNGVIWKCIYYSILRLPAFSILLLSMHNVCEIELLEKCRDRHVSHEMYWAIHGIAPCNIQDMFSYVQDTHNINTRSNTSEHLYLPRCRLEFSKRNFRYRGVHNWNPLSFRYA